jgi:hypothetical protein
MCIVRTYNTDNSAVLRDIVGADLLDEAQRKEEGKEANEAEAEGPAPGSTFHVDSLSGEKRKGKKRLSWGTRRAVGGRRYGWLCALFRPMLLGYQEREMGMD